MSSLTRKIRSPERGDAFLNGFILDKVSLTRGHLNKNLEERKCSMQRINDRPTTHCFYLSIKVFVKIIRDQNILYLEENSKINEN